MKKLYSAASAKDSLSYSPTSSQDISELIRLKDSVTMAKAQLASTGSPEQIRASIDLMQSSTFKHSFKPPGSLRRSKPSDSNPSPSSTDPRRSSELLLSLADHPSPPQSNIKVDTDVIMQVFRDMGIKASVDQMVTLIQRLKRADSEGLNQRLAEEQHKTDDIKARLMDSRTQVSTLSQSVKQHTGELEQISEIVTSLYSVTKDVCDAWCKERAQLKSLQRTPFEAENIKKSLQETEKRYAETKRLLTAETLKMTQIRSKLTNSETGVDEEVMTEPLDQVRHLQEAQIALTTRLEQVESTISFISQVATLDFDGEIESKEAELASLIEERKKMEAGLRAIIDLAG